MTLNIELPSNKISRFNEGAKLTGLSPDEFARKIVELIVDTTEEEFESWLETLEILADKDFAMRLQHSIYQAENGQLTDWEDAKRELAPGFDSRRIKNNRQMPMNSIATAFFVDGVVLLQS